ncbi:hypothetical protein GCM10022254_29620 [Actinomadura meridiana]|uniref:Uncharacterized protein n=1 Tax=Actinomadura meridiana TaxID=559626 RepID=A0ABP8C0U7_9ACTN
MVVHVSSRGRGCVMCAGDGQGQRRGVFIPAEALVLVVIVVVGVMTATLAALFPAVGLPVGVGAAVIGLLYGIYHNTWHRNVSPLDQGPSPVVSPGDAPRPGLINEGGENRG